MTRKKDGPRKVPAAARNATALEQADTKATRAVAPYQQSWPVRALSAFSKLGDQPPMLAISSAVLGAGLVRGDRRMTRAGARMVVAHVIATAAKNFIKHRIDRTRPHLLVDEGRYKMEAGRHEAKEETSFPSGHTAGAVAVARAFARDYPEHRGAAYAAAGVIALAQIPRCTHYPSDVAAGTAVGLAAEGLVKLVAGATERKDDRTAAAEHAARQAVAEPGL
ncbi:MAG: phosphatase family protein [Alphaproteobacteria bacterium]|nr:phosphatase family protein [Alphaproteobacteria bacterium]